MIILLCLDQFIIKIKKDYRWRWKIFLSLIIFLTYILQTIQIKWVYSIFSLKIHFNFNPNLKNHLPETKSGQKKNKIQLNFKNKSKITKEKRKFNWKSNPSLKKINHQNKSMTMILSGENKQQAEISHLTPLNSFFEKLELMIP